MLALIVLARLVEVGVQEFSGDIDELAQRSCHRGTIDVDVEHAHEDRHAQHRRLAQPVRRSEEHTSELQSLMRISYAVFCLKKKTKNIQLQRTTREAQTTHIQQTHMNKTNK